MKVFQMLQIAVMAVLACGLAYAGVPFPSAETPKAIDVGPLVERTPMSVTVVLKMSNPSEAEALLKSIHTPGDAQFRKFLSPEQFKARFSPAEAEVSRVIAGLARYGLTSERSSTATLRVTGMPENFERAFSVSLHSYSVPAHGEAEAYTYHAPANPMIIPAEISASVAAVVGLNNRATMFPHHLAPAPVVAKARLTKAQAPKENAPGSLFVNDFANLYDVVPLYRAGITGAGQTLGIMTFASFTASDAFAYWAAAGLTVSPTRITIINVDGGSGAPSDDAGSDETTLDVEQSGGIAPGAKIRVYEAPNTDQGFVDLFAVAAEDNLAQSLSISWGEWEWFANFQNSGDVLLDGQLHSVIFGVHEFLVRMGLQGQSVFASSGDEGAYDVNRGCPYPFCSNTLSVDYPGSDPAITSAGGTTLPGFQAYRVPINSPLYIDVPQERVWGWDYLEPLCSALKLSLVNCGIYAVGGGGGVSILFPEPWYQVGIPGMQTTQPGVRFIEEGVTELYLPGNFAGRNVPDISFNADPQTGYLIFYTSNVHGPEVIQAGGTSFVAPQLNGVTSLLDQYVAPRLGLMNVPMYLLAKNGVAYGAGLPLAPMHAIAYGDNWFYYGSNGYNPGAGLGTLDVWNFAQVIHGLR
jgi:subtilase family serine protease